MLQNNKNVKVENFGDGTEWDTFVEANICGSIYHTSGWKNALEDNFRNIKAELVTVRNNSSEEIIAGLPIFSISSFLTGKRLVSIPFALHGTPLVSTNEDKNLLLDKIVNKFQSDKYLFLEIKSYCSSLKGDSNFRLVSSKLYKTHTLILNKSPSLLMNNFHKKAVRIPIKKSLKNGLQLKIGSSESSIVDFYQIYSISRRRLGLPVFPIGFFESLWKHFHPQNQLTILLAIFKDKTVGSNLLLKYKDTVVIEYGADLIDYRHLHVNHFLDWSSIVLAYNEGYNKLSFGSTHSHHEGLMTYKNRWGTRQDWLPFYYYPNNLSSISRRKNNSIQYEIVRKIFLYSPESVYKSLSSFIYNHLG